MAYTVTSALIGSLIISLTVIPMLCHLFLNKDIGHEDSKFVHWCKDRYKVALDWALNSKAKVLKIAGGLMLVTIIVAKLLGSEFLPELDEGAMWVSIDLPASVSIQEAKEQARINQTQAAIQANEAEKRKSFAEKQWSVMSHSS